MLRGEKTATSWLLAEWREAHEAFWRQYRDDVLDDDTQVVVERFRLVT